MKHRIMQPQERGENNKPESLKEVIRRLFIIYREADSAIDVFKTKSGIKCVQGCGLCCLSPQVHTTSLEMIPIAITVSRQNRTNMWAKRALAADLKGPCIFYKPDSRFHDKGRCGIYPIRPLICRLFGFSGNRDKHGMPYLITCKYIKNRYPGCYDNAVELIGAGVQVPLMSDYTRRLMDIDIYTGTKQYPINESFYMALSKIALARHVKKRYLAVKRD